MDMRIFLASLLLLSVAACTNQVCDDKMLTLTVPTDMTKNEYLDTCGGRPDCDTVPIDTEAHAAEWKSMSCSEVCRTLGAEGPDCGPMYNQGGIYFISCTISYCYTPDHHVDWTSKQPDIQKQ
jgi:hypothetical protein